MKYIKKSVVVDAVQFTGRNKDELEEFTCMHICQNSYGLRFLSFSMAGNDGTEEPLIARPDDWIVRLPDGDFTVCDANEFKKEYCPVEDSLDKQIKRAEQIMEEKRVEMDLAIGHYDFASVCSQYIEACDRVNALYKEADRMKPSCDKCKNYEPRGKPNHLCSTCNHFTSSVFSDPCIRCVDNDQWEPESEAVKAFSRYRKPQHKETT